MPLRKTVLPKSDIPTESWSIQWPRDRAYLVAVSGGLDSMVIWHLLHSSGYSDLMLVHIDHGLRGEASTGDQEFVRQEAEKTQTACEIRCVDVRSHASAQGLSLETAARELRYRAIAEVARATGRQQVFLAHHADDQVETILMNLFRGSGSRGLSGMQRESSREIDGLSLTFLRPLLDTPRALIRKYAETHAISWRDDESNASSFALRNRIRNRLMPEIEETFGRDAKQAILRAAKLASLDEAWSRSALGEMPIRGEGFDVVALRSLPEARRNRLLLSWLRKSGVPDCGWDEVERSAQVLVSDGRPAKASLPGNYQIRRRAGVLFLERVNA